MYTCAIYLIVLQFHLSSKLLLARMQVPGACRLLKEVSRNRHIASNADEQLFRETSKSSQLVHNAEKKSYLGMSSMVNLSHPNTGVKFLKLKWRKFDHLANHVGGARNIFCELFGHNKAENTFWLDSSSREKVCLLPDNYSY
jgi:para-aminobenzoate synthetase